MLDSKNLNIFLISVFCILEINCAYPSGQCTVSPSFYQHHALDELPPPNNCTLMVIYDLSKNFTSSDAFEISIRNFLLQYTTNFCYINKLEFVKMFDKNWNEICTKAIDTTQCYELLKKEALKYDNYTIDYPELDLFDNRETVIKEYSNFLNAALTQICPCSKNSVVLLTNRIVNISDFVDTKLKHTLANSCTQLYVILLGRAEKNANDLLSKVYQNAKNIKFLNLPNFDCLIYLNYCIAPCDKQAPKCLKSDFDDCQQLMPMPNPHAVTAVQAWYVLSFSENITEEHFRNVTSNIVTGIQWHHGEFGNFTTFKIKFVVNSTFTKTFFYVEDFDDYVNSIQKFLESISLSDIVVEVTDAISDDNDEMNKRFSYAPTQDSDNPARLTPIFIVVLTDYASPTFNISNKDGTVYVYNNNESYSYYSKKFRPNNDGRFRFNYRIWSDKIFVYPVQYNITLGVPTDGPANTFPTQPSRRPTKATSSGVSISSTSSTTSQASTTNDGSKSKKPSSNAVKNILLSIGGVSLAIAGGIGIFCYRRKKRWQKKFGQIESRYGKKSAKKVFPSESLTFDYWELTWSKIILKNAVLGSGAFGEIVRGKLLNGVYEDDIIEVAIKMPQKTASPAVRNQFLAEIKIMKLINGNRNIVKMYGCITQGDRICLVLEYCYNLDLLHYVKNVLKDTSSTEMEENLKKNTKKEFFIFSWQISHGMQFLASKDIIHRDLAARNILIDTDKCAKICDFGLSIQKNEEDFENGNIDIGKMPIKWLAIESLKSSAFSLQSDIWSFGILLYEMYSFGAIPFPDIESTELLEHLEGGNRPEKPEFCDEEIYSIMSKCWIGTPASRPQIAELIEDFTKLLEDTNGEYGYLELKNDK